MTHVVVRGAAEHNLKTIDVEFPRNSLTVVTGLSGSGKSSFAYDIVYREGQRRFVETLSSYARQYMGKLDRPRVEHIEGLSPTISIDQKTISRNPRSTVGTITEILDHLRLLFARLGVPHCPTCDRPIASRTVDQIVDSAFLDWPDQEVLVCAPIVRARKGEYRKELEDLRTQGFVRVRVDGVVRRLDEDIRLARYERHTIEVVYDRIRCTADRRSRFSESVEKALALGDGVVDLVVDDNEHVISSRFACVHCGISVPELEPRLFSFNSPQGSCPGCLGLGKVESVDLAALVPNGGLSLRQGAFASTKRGKIELANLKLTELAPLLRRHEADLDTPWDELPLVARRELLHGIEATDQARGFVGIVPRLEAAHGAAPDGPVAPLWGTAECAQCEGTRLRPEARAVRFREWTLPKLAALTVAEALRQLEGLDLRGRESVIGQPIIQEVLHRLRFLERVGLSYLDLDRSADTLSGGEAQRIRLASQLGSGLRGVLYVLDEPSIGLHPRDNQALLGTLRSLRDLGNTVLVVEHDQETIEAADHVLEIGPRAGSEGGELVAAGTVANLRSNALSLTGRYLAGIERIEIPAARRPVGSARLVVRGAQHHNLKNIDVEIPLGLFVAVAGVSGSGKSTLIDGILHRGVARALGLESPPPGRHDGIDGLAAVDKVIRIDQKPIGRTPRSNPGTYTKVFDEIRDLFTRTATARVRGYHKGRFSFNVKGGRCEACGGAGVDTIHMQFLSDVEVVCEECHGQRYNAETLEVTYRGKSIFEVLDLSIADATEFFVDVPKIYHTLRTLVDVGLGYVRVGQPSTTLSGGEAQRVKLAFELRKQATGRTLYLLDEPTTGLHFDDVRRLLGCLNELVERGNTVVVIEHNLDVLKVADHVIELGPDGGEGGGHLIAAATPERVAALKTPTGVALAGVLRPRRKAVKPRAATPRVSPREPDDRFVITGAREHNLKNLRVEIPRNKLTVITGPSGSGKTTLAFDILFAEGQRRYVESLSTYARRFLGRMQRAAVDRVEGIAPAVAIDQKTGVASPRSTVATTTEIYDYLRLLFARVGEASCATCGAKLSSTTPSAAARALESDFAGQRVYLLAPLAARHADAYPSAKTLADVASSLLEEGYARVLIASDEVRLEEVQGAMVGRSPLTEVDLVIDRLIPGQVARGRLAESVETAYERGHGRAAVFVRETGERRNFYRLPTCPAGHRGLEEELSPRLFSFNHHSGACPTCHGMGHHRELDFDLLVVDPSRPLFEGAMDHRLGNWIAREKGRPRKVLDALCAEDGIDLSQPVAKLGKKAIAKILEGTGDRAYAVRFRRFLGGRKAGWSRESTWEGLRALVGRWYQKADSPRWRQILEQFMSMPACSECGGGRLRRELLAVRVGGKAIHEVCRLSIEAAAAYFQRLQLPARDQQIAKETLDEIGNRLQFLLEVGLDYLHLDRTTESLSGGEAQRIRLATQIGNRLVGMLYVLDEPTIGLHQRDNERLLQSLLRLRDHGNSVVIVEHDPQTIDCADHVIDLGPGAGIGGGEILAQGTPAVIREHPRSITGPYLTGARGLAVPASRRSGDGGAISILGARQNNLKDIDVRLPTGTFIAVTGVSGSGKSSLIMDTLGAEIARRFLGKRVVPGTCRRFVGLDRIDGAALIDQAPIGRNPASNAATYTGLFGHLRSLFAGMPQAKARGYDKGRFSFNTPGGRCEACEGKGATLVEMHFLSDVWVQCEVCAGRRYDRETLAIRFKGHTIADILDLEVKAALELLNNHPRMSRILGVLDDVGLGYLPLGQSATTLSGGEAQRIKLATELAREGHGRTLYVLDEPTTGLHFSDVEKLVQVLHRFVDRGDTVVVIEHNLDVVKCADFVVDLGPEGGARGGEVVAYGTPEEIALHPTSHTGRFLSPLLSSKPRSQRKRAQPIEGRSP
ncbi:MAG: excinuclease ABC subunit UvrA [Planctomycetota bacterium]